MPAIIPSLRMVGGVTSESLKPITMAGMLRIRLVKGPATPVSKRAFREETVLSMRITAPSVPKGGSGKGKKKGQSRLYPIPPRHQIMAHFVSKEDEYNCKRISRASNDQRGGHCQNEKDNMDGISSHENNYFFFL